MGDISGTDIKRFMEYFGFTPVPGRQPTILEERIVGGVLSKIADEIAEARWFTARLHGQFGERDARLEDTRKALEAERLLEQRVNLGRSRYDSIQTTARVLGFNVQSLEEAEESAKQRYMKDEEAEDWDFDDLDKFLADLKSEDFAAGRGEGLIVGELVEKDGNLVLRP